MEGGDSLKRKAKKAGTSKHAETMQNVQAAKDEALVSIHSSCMRICPIPVMCRASVERTAPMPRLNPWVQVYGSDEYKAAVGEFIEEVQAGLGDLYPIAVGADEGVGPQGPAYLAALRERNEHVSEAVPEAVELEPAEGSGVQTLSDANVLLCQSWQRHNNAQLACSRNPTLMQRDDCPRSIVGGRGPCAHWREVDPLYNYDPQIDKFRWSATCLLQGAFARDVTQSAAAGPYSVQWRNGVTRSDADQTLSYSLPSSQCMHVSYEHLDRELRAAEGLSRKVSIDGTQPWIVSAVIPHCLGIVAPTLLHVVVPTLSCADFPVCHHALRLSMLPPRSRRIPCATSSPSARSSSNGTCSPRT